MSKTLVTRVHEEQLRVNEMFDCKKRPSRQFKFIHPELEGRAGLELVLAPDKSQSDSPAFTNRGLTP